jgi:hypothetical protein
MFRVKDDGLSRRISIVILKKMHFELNPENIAHFCIQVIEAAFLRGEKVLEVVVETGRNHLHVHTAVERTAGCVFLVLGITVVDELQHCVVIRHHQTVEFPLVTKHLLQGEGIG